MDFAGWILLKHSGAAQMPPDEGPLRILMVLENAFTPTGGGAESQVRTLALKLQRLGHQVTILTPRSSYGPRPTAERCWNLAVGRISYPYWPKVGSLVLFGRLGALLWQRRHRYDVWHVHIAHNMGAITCLMGKLLGVPVIVKVSGWFELERGVLAPGASRAAALSRRWLKSATVLQAISTRIARNLVERGFPADRVITLPNAVDTSRFDVRTGVRQSGGPFTVVFVGRMVPEKGLETLFDAWKEAFGAREDVRLLLVGDGPLDAPLRARAERLGIARQVQFLGHQDHVEPALAQADLGVLPSLVEGLSNTLLEYMAGGLPVVASRVSGSEDLVVPGRNGWLFSPSDVGDLSACLREAQALSAERLSALGRQARADVESTAGLEIIVGRLLALYRGADPTEVGGAMVAAFPGSTTGAGALAAEADASGGRSP
jgi:glycosyltransferase involved in cell wall biosynthesis